VSEVKPRPADRRPGSGPRTQARDSEPGPEPRSESDSVGAGTQAPSRRLSVTETAAAAGRPADQRPPKNFSLRVPARPGPQVIMTRMIMPVIMIMESVS
jgi:hypothetical protein